MTFRPTPLRAIGLGVAAIVMMAAIQLLLLSFEMDPLLSTSNIASLTEWIRDRPRPGAGILVGVALALVTLWMMWAMVRSFGTDRRTLTVRRKDGWTKLDRPSLERAIEQRLMANDRRNDIDVRITRRGRIDAAVTTPDPSSDGPAREVRELIDTMCVERALPCRVGRITTTVPRRINARRNVR